MLLLGDCDDILHSEFNSEYSECSTTKRLKIFFFFITTSLKDCFLVKVNCKNLEYTLKNIKDISTISYKKKDINT